MQLSTYFSVALAALVSSAPTSSSPPASALIPSSPLSKLLPHSAPLAHLAARGNANTADILVYPQAGCRGTPQRFTLGMLGTCHSTSFTFNSLSVENVGANMFGKNILAWAHPNKGCTSGIGGLPPTGFRLTNGANCHDYTQGDAVFLETGVAA